MRRLTFTAPAAIEATDTDARRLVGVALPYGQRGYTSAGPITVDAGAIRVPENLRAVKLFREHGRQVPIGYAADATDSAEALRMGFTIARTPDGDLALLEASEGLRDALSVELHNVTMDADHVTGADLVAVAQVAVPAFAGAQLTATLTDDEQADVFDLATQITEKTKPTEPEDSEDAPPSEAPPGESESSMTSRPTSAHASLTPTRAARPSLTPQVWADQAAAAVQGASDARDINAALSDITPANSGSADLFPRPAWLGELWTPQAADRPLVDAIGVSPLTSMEMQGWKWIQEPTVAPYAGNKTAIPSSPASIGPATAPAQRIAGGWDLDRIYVDFDSGFLTAFQQAAVRDYKRKSQAYFIDGHAAVTGPPAVPAAAGFLADATDLGTAADLTTGLQMLASFLTGNGANVSFIAMASDVYGDFLSLGGDAAPWWLSGSSSITFTGSVNVAGTTIAVDPGLANGTMVGGDRDAVSLWETGPINVNAINLPNGGVDFALFGYWAQMVHDDDGLAKVTVTAVTGLTAGNQSDDQADDQADKKKKN